MNKFYLRWIRIATFTLAALLIGPGQNFISRASDDSPAGLLQSAWLKAQEAGSYRFISDIDQKYVPRSIPEMIGQQETTLSLSIDGAVLLPDQAYSEMKAQTGQNSQSVVMLRNGEQSFMLEDSQLKPVDNALTLGVQSNDVLGYLVAAEQVTLLAPPENHPELARYSFIVNGPRYAEYVRQQAEASIKAEPGAPQGITIKPIPVLQKMSGQGELWIDQDGFPVRQVLDLKMPEVNEQYGASIHMIFDISAYGKIKALPQAVQDSNGTWHLEGSLQTGLVSNLGAFSGFESSTSQASANQTVTPAASESWLAHLSSILPLHVSPSSGILFIVILLIVIMVRFYRRNPKRCHTVIVSTLIPIMVFSPVLESAGVVRFFERQVQAAEEKAAAMPGLLHALGLNVELPAIPSAAAGEESSQSIADANLNTLSPQALLNQAAADKPKDSPVYDGVTQTLANSGQEALQTCGYGTPGVDTDSDGLTDLVENCLGTVSSNPDTDNDSIPDGIEVNGFDWNGQHWDSDPLNADSNRDGVSDTEEWSQTLAPKGLAINEDLDNDGIPNLWDDDDDQDDVPDYIDLSPSALTDYATDFNLTTSGGITTGTETIEIEVQPLDKNHLRYSTTALDWPSDLEGNVQDRDDSSEDLRLLPFLLVTTNIKPSDELLQQYDLRAWYDEEQGKYILLVTLQPLEDGGSVYAYYAKVAYAAADLTDAIGWSARVVWMAEMQQDSDSCTYIYYSGRYECEVVTETTTIHQYQETFRITGLQVTKSESFEASAIGTPGYAVDDLYLFKLLFGLNNTFQSYQALENQTGETALQELYTRFTNGDTITHTFGVPAGPDGVIAMTPPQIYLNTEAGMADMGNNVLPNYLSNGAYSSPLCQDFDGNPIQCASLLLASETHSGTRDLSGLTGSDPRFAPLDQLNISLESIPIFSVRNTTLRMYEKNSVTSAWQVMAPSRMLEMVEMRYYEDYPTMLHELYPTLRTQDARFIAYTAYLWAYGGLLNVISVDGKLAVPELPDETALAIATAINDGLATNGLNYVGLATNLPSILTDVWNITQGTIQMISTGLDHANVSKGLLIGKVTVTAIAIAAAIATIIMDCINIACAANPDLKMCGREAALLASNLLIGTINISVQVAVFIVGIVETVSKDCAIVVKNIEVAGCVFGIIAAAIGIVMSWVSFGIIFRHTHNSDPVAWRMALGLAIVTIFWLSLLAGLNFIPIIGPIITAILGFIDYIIGLFTNLFGAKQWSLAEVILELFYSAAIDTSIESASFGDINSDLADPNKGLVGGNDYVVTAPASGVINKEKRGDNDDLEHSFIKGELKPVQDPNNPPPNPFNGAAENTDYDCTIDSGKANCSNTAIVRFALTPAINGTANFVARILYQTVWEEDMFYGAAEVKHHYPEGQLPEEDVYNSVVLDVLPATLTDLWNWSALNNPDRDGDGLTNVEETSLGTNPELWDTDLDGLSDWYEVEVCQGCNQVNPDTDGDGLNDRLELHVGTRVELADSDGDGLSDGQELRHVENGVLVGGWNITQLKNPDLAPDSLTVQSSSKLAVWAADSLMVTNDSYWVSSDPLMSDDDGDSLNAYEEMQNGLSPQARNALVPVLDFSVTPTGGIPDARPGAFWLPGTPITIAINLVNIATGPVNNTLTLTLPRWLGVIGGGDMQGDRKPPMVMTESGSGTTLSWDFTGSDALQLYEAVNTTIIGQVNQGVTSASDEIILELPYGSIQMHKSILANVDGDNPSVVLFAPSDGDYLSGSYFVVGGTATDATTWITERGLSIVPQGQSVNFTALPAGQGVWAYTWDLPQIDGVYTLTARAKDAMNHETSSSNVTVTVDNTPPVATLASEMDNGTVHLSGSAIDNLAGVEYVQLMIDGQPWRSVPFTNNQWSYDWAVNENAQGDHTVSVRAIDRSRNQSDILTEKILVDSIAPSSIINSGADKNVPPAVKPNTPFTLTGVADEGGHLQQPAAQADLKTGMDAFDDSTVWLGLSSIHENDGGVLAAWIGDFNADRLSDLVVGLPGPAGDAGQVAVIYGRAGGWPVPPDLKMLASSPTRFTGTAGERLGSFVAAAGDVNADSRDDLLIAGRDSMSAYLILGRPGPLGSVTLQGGQSIFSVQFQTPQPIEGLAAAGDVNGDSYGDLLIQAGGTVYLVLGRGNPWPETFDVAGGAEASFAGVTGALSVGDVDNDQQSEWVTLAAGAINLFDWNNHTATTTFTTSDLKPHAVALGTVDGDQKADWLYSDGDNRILVYGSGVNHTFTGYNGFFVAPGDVDGDGRADLLLTDASGTAALISHPANGSPAVIATIAGVGGAANAPYATGADFNSDGSSDLLLIPSQAAAEMRGFDAPDFSSGYISPQFLPLGASSPANTAQDTIPSLLANLPVELRTLIDLGIWDFALLSASFDTRYVDDDGVCDGNTPCLTTIQDAVDASDGGGDTVIVYPGVYPAFHVPGGVDYDHLTIRGVSADAVFVEGGTGDAIQVSANGVHLSNLTVRNAVSGVALQDGSGEPTWAGGEETVIDHLLVHSVQYPINISQSAALSVTNSTLVGDGTHAILNVSSTLNTAVHTWHPDQEMKPSGQATALPISPNGGLVGAADKLYAMPGANSMIYTSTPNPDGTLGAWTTAFQVPDEMPAVSGSAKSTITLGGNYLFQVHTAMSTPDFGAFNGEIRALVVAANGDIYAGGHFSTVGTVSASNIARWDGTEWHPLGTAISNGVNGTVYAITITPNGNVYVGGRFDYAYDSTHTSASPLPAQNVAYWDGSLWHPLGGPELLGNGVSGDDPGWPNTPPLPGTVYALASSSDGYVFIGGNFRHFHASYNTYIAGWHHCWNFVIWKPDNTWSALNGNPNLIDIGNSTSDSVRSMVWTGGKFLAPDGGTLYAGGSFYKSGTYSAQNTAYLHQNSIYESPQWYPMGYDIPTRVSSVAWAGGTNVFAVSDDPVSPAVYQWDSSSYTWSDLSTGSGMVNSPVNAMAADAHGNLFLGLDNGMLMAYRPNESVGWGFENLENEGAPIWSLLHYNRQGDSSGQALVGRGSPGTGGIRIYSLEGVFRRNLSGSSWEWVNLPISFNHFNLPSAIAADNAGNLYTTINWGGDSLLYRLKKGSQSWEMCATMISVLNGNPPDQHNLTDLYWADGYLYALAYDPSGQWYLFRYDPASPVIKNWPGQVNLNWTSMGLTSLPTGAATASSRSMATNGMGSIYVLQASGAYRYRIGADTWDTLGSPTVSFSLTQKPLMAYLGNYLYVYASVSTGTNIFRYGAVGLPDLRLSLARTALVEPDSAGSFRWTNLSTGGTYRFLINSDQSNAWIAPSSATWTPALPTSAARLTSGQADFVSSTDGLYRLGANSSLNAGYHQYMAVAHVYPSQDACALCDSGSLTWGANAFASIRQAVESGAARVLVHPGRYPQTFYLVSGVEVIGSGAESTIIEPPVGPAATLVTAEGAAGASLARITLAGGSLWQGFLAEGGSRGLKLTRSIFRSLETGVRLRDGSQVEIVNNTFVSNNNGIVIEGTTPVNVRNNILAYNNGTALTHGAVPASLSSTYNDFWSNGTDMDPVEVSPGSLFVDPHFISLSGDDLRLAERSPLIDMGSPTDPTTPGGGERVDIGYAEYNSAKFYVSKDYSETSLNDGLSWGINAFDGIQPALDAAAAALHDLQGALPEGGYSVAVGNGTYNEQVIIPSHVRLVGSGAGVTTIDANHTGSGVTFDGVIDSELSSFTVQNAGGAGVDVKGAASGIKIDRNVILNNASHGVSLEGSSSAEVSFNTITGNTGAGVYAGEPGSWALVNNNIIAANAAGMQAVSGALIRNTYNLLNNTTNVDNVTAGEGTITSDPAFSEGSHYIPSANSPAIDAADPRAEVPLAGGLCADLGYKELIASPLTLLFGPEIKSTVTGNTGVAQVEVGVVRVVDPAEPVTATLPTSLDWIALTPAQTGQPLFYWSTSLNQENSGLYRVYSRATDEAGNTETEPLDWYDGAFVVDGSAPTLNWGTPALPGSTNAAAVLAVAQAAGTVPAGTGSRDDITQNYFHVTEPDGTERNYPAEGGQAWIPLSATGSYTINAIAVDEAGNQTSRNATINVTGSSSIATVTNLLNGSAVFDTHVTLRGYVRFSAVGSGQVKVSAGDMTVQARLESSGAQFTAWTAAITLPAGESTRTITVTPSLGGTNGTPTTLNLIVDTTPPTLGVTSPAAGATVIRTTAFGGTASDTGSGLKEVQVSIDGGYTWRQAVTNNGAWSLDWDMMLNQDSVSYPVQVRAVDAAGNMTLDQRTVSVDNMAPTGLAPVIFNQPEGQHLEIGSNLTIDWNVPVDASGSGQVLLAADQVADTTPSNVVNGTSSSATFDKAGDWYVHLSAKDAAGNQIFYHYGPWHVRDTANSTPLNERRQSIIIDGDLDLEHGEWQASDLLGIDARSSSPQELYASWDGRYVFLGWSGAWWTLDGVLWAYVESAGTGASTMVDGTALPAGLNASQAIEIDGPDDGALWNWNGSAWIKDSTSLDFANGQTGDTEVRVPWIPSGTQGLRLIAFALPRAADTPQADRFTVPFGLVNLDLTGGLPAGQPSSVVIPWAVFPTTNPLGGTMSQSFVWNDAAGTTQVNDGQPSARTIMMNVTSPQASGIAWAAGSELDYIIQLANPEPTAIENMIISLAATDGLSFQVQSGMSCSTGNSLCSISVPTLGAGQTTQIILKGQLASTLTNLQSVTSTFTLSAGTTDFTPESQSEVFVTHRVDSQAPSVTIDTPSGAAIPAGSMTFTGAASDFAFDGGDGSGVARVEVSLDGSSWQTAAGTLVWSSRLAIPTNSPEVTLWARAVDNAGLTGSEVIRTFIVDTTAPAVNWTAPAIVTNNLAAISGTTSDPAPADSLVERVEVQVDGRGAWLSAFEPLPPQNGFQSWTWNWETPADDGVMHRLCVRASDEAGNTSVPDCQQTVVDTISPYLIVDQPKTVPLVINSDGSLLTGAVSDGAGVQAVSILIYGPDAGIYIPSQQALLTNGMWGYVPDLTGWVVGTYTLRVQALDINGNLSMNGPYLFEVTAAMLQYPKINIVTVTLDGTTEGDGLDIMAGDLISWQYTVTNLGDLPLNNVAVTDSVTGVTPTYVSGDTNGNGNLDLTETWIFQATGTAAEGSYQNIGTASATSPSGISVTAQDGSSYLGANPQIAVDQTTMAGSIEVEAQEVVVGTPITWIYKVTNNGNVILSGIVVTDDQNVMVSCPQATLDPNASMDCTAAGEAIVGNYSNTGTAVGTYADSAGHNKLVMDTDTSSYTGTKAAAMVLVSSTLNPSTYHEKEMVSLTAVVSGDHGIPTGKVTFIEGDNILPGCADLDLASGTAVCVAPIFAAGTHALTAEYGGDEVYLPGSGSFDQVVNKAAAILTISNLDYTYDGTQKAVSVTTVPAGLSGVVVTYNGGETLPLEAGVYEVVASLENLNYQAQDALDTLFIRQAILIITANNQRREYQQPNPPFTFSYSGFVGGENESVLMGQPSLSTTAAFDSSAGDYPIDVMVGTLSAVNYTFKFIRGILTIGPTDQKIAFDALPNRTYGDADFQVTAMASSGLPVSFSVGASDACEISGNIVHITAAGSCTVTAAQEGDSNYHPAVPVSQSFAILQAQATVQLGDLITEYDGTGKAATVTTDPAGVSVLVTYDNKTTLPVNAGGYAVVATINDPNYQGASAYGTLVINPRPIAVTADSQNKVYGDTDPALTYLITGGSLVSGDSFSGALSRVPGENVGEYAIGQGSLTAGSNYLLTFKEANLTINPATLTVKADDQSRPYSDPNPTFTATITGFKLGDTQIVVSGKPACSTTAAPLSVPKSYDITCTTGSLSAANYSFSFVKGTLIIGKENAAITYTGDMQVTTSKANAKATVILAATLGEDQDGSLGDQLTGQQILFQVFNFGSDLNNGSPVASCTASIGNVVNGKGYGSCPVSLGAADPYQVKVSLVTNPYYTANYENIAVLVNDPGAGMTAGGGRLVDPSTSFQANFGFTVKFLKNGNIQGNSLYIYRVVTDLSTLVPGAPREIREYNWIIKSNVLQGLNIYNCPIGAKSGCRATITGKNTIQAVDRLTGVVYSLGGNYQFQLDVSDNSEPGIPSSMIADQYAIRVWNSSGVYYSLGNAYGANGKLLAPLAISGGNIQVKAR